MTIVPTKVTREQKINAILLHKHGVESKLARLMSGLGLEPAG